MSDDDNAILAEVLRETIARDRFPKAILAKLDPRLPIETLPPPKPPGERSMAVARKRRR